ncbi:Hypothetical predicted protein [Paramuricea clavata]|uniref:Uncharacterized protein n=1 Tax=Paramuricea clavata TaxID=317549 RepID=A0A7D9JKM0_PARCT|nr:Hypothetical predicted protein [Paramuricea clavata]
MKSEKQKFHVFFQVLFVMFTINTGCSAWRNPPGLSGVVAPCPPGPQGEVGPPGDPGQPGYAGLKGIKGEAATPFARPPPGEKCRCPSGPKGSGGETGDPGRVGLPGRIGGPGPWGLKGNQGLPGVPGIPGVPGPPLPRYPPSTPDVMYIPVAFHGKVPRTMCHHIRKQAYVPGVPHDWLGWYETGKSSYLTFEKWLYFSSRFQCPCSVPIPPGLTPSPAELLRLL